jgi:hypothetical protein
MTEEVKVEKPQEDWMQKKWRPMMAIMYMLVCIFDFILFPIMFTAVQFWEVEAANDAFRQWVPITLGGGGLFHVAMGAVLGVSAWSRGQEKIAGAAANNQPALPVPSPAPAINTTAETPPMKRNDPPLSNEPSLYASAVSQEQPKVVAGYKGKPSPISGSDPLI